MYKIHFDSEGEQISLPINPDKVTVKINNKNKTIELLNLGEVNVIKNPGLTDISFDILLPGQEYPFVTNFRSPKFYLDKFKEYKKNKKPMRITIYRDTDDFDVNMDVTLEDYSYEERAGEEGDIYVSLNLKEYRSYHTKELTLQPLPTLPDSNEPQKVIVTEENQRPAKETAKQYTVKKGDTLWAIAKKELNSGSKYHAIAKLNGIHNPNLIYPGQILKLP